MPPCLELGSWGAAWHWDLRAQVSSWGLILKLLSTILHCPASPFLWAKDPGGALELWAVMLRYSLLSPTAPQVQGHLSDAGTYSWLFTQGQVWHPECSLAGSPGLSAIPASDDSISTVKTQIPLSSWPRWSRCHKAAVGVKLMPWAEALALPALTSWATSDKLLNLTVPQLSHL